MRIIIANKNVQIHTTPLEDVRITGSKVSILFDDIHETRWCITFSPYQAVKVTTIDCIYDGVINQIFDIPDAFLEVNKSQNPFGKVYRKYLLEVLDSDYVQQLKRSVIDNSATFLEKARHFILPFQDNVIEIVAWNYELSQVD